MYTFAYLGMKQIVIILVIALLIFGPQKVPELGRQIGGALRDLKKMSNEVQSAFDLDDHPSYDRYEPPTYEYTPPVSTTYDHEPLDQYGLPIASEHPAIEGTNVALAEALTLTEEPELPLTPELPATIENTTVTHPEVATIKEPDAVAIVDSEPTAEVSSVDTAKHVDVKSA